MATRYLLTSESEIKKSVVHNRISSSIKIECKNFKIADNVEQPCGIGGMICCKNRIIAALNSGAADNFDAIISVENAIDSNSTNEYWDEVHIMFYDCKSGIYYYEHGMPIYFQKT
jgi:hypothetical protein